MSLCYVAILLGCINGILGRTEVKNSRLSSLRIAMSKEICRECLITRSFRPSNVPLKYDYKRVSNRDDNKILEAL